MIHQILNELNEMNYIIIENLTSFDLIAKILCVNLNAYKHLKSNEPKTVFQIFHLQ